MALMQVPRVTQEFLPLISGPANQALALSRGLEELGISSPILTTTPGVDKTVQAAGVTTRRFRPIVAAPNFRASFSLLRWLMTCQASVIHVHGWRNPASDGAIAVARYRGIPIVVQAHGVAFGYRYSPEARSVRSVRSGYDGLIHGFVTRSVAAVVAATQLEADELAEYGFPKSKIVVIPVGLNPAFFVDSVRVCRPLDDSFTILTVARLAPRRNIEQIIRALASLRARGVSARLRVVGPEVTLAAGDAAGYKQRLQELARKLGLSQYITFVGSRQGTDLLEEYKRADVFVSTSLYENFGQSIAEAAATGLPIVSTPTGVSIDLSQDSQAGLLVPFNDAEATAAVLERLYVCPGQRQHLGQSARRLAAAEFDWRKIVPRYLELYRMLSSNSALT